MPTNDVNQAIVVLLRLACVLSLWHAPVPWVHIHTADAPELVHHIRQFHPELLATGHDEPPGWHWHTVLPPWGRTPSSAPEEDESSPWTIIEFAPVVVVGTMSWHVDVDYAVWRPVHQPLMSSPLALGLGFANELIGISLLNRSAQQVLSVCLC